MIISLTGRIFADREKAHRFYLGEDLDKKVNFTFVNVKTGKETTKWGLWTFGEALALAERKTRDGRYRNFEFVID